MDAGAEMGTLDTTTVIASHGGKEIVMNTSPERSKFLAEEMKKRGIKPATKRRRQFHWPTSAVAPP